MRNRPIDIFKSLEVSSEEQPQSKILMTHGHWECAEHIAISQLIFW